MGRRQHHNSHQRQVLSVSNSLAYVGQEWVNVVWSHRTTAVIFGICYPVVYNYPILRR